MSDFRFANPNWSHAIWLVAAVVALLFWLDWRRSDVLSRFVSAAMQPQLVHRLSKTRRWLSLGCLGLAGLSLVLALMRPQWGLTYQQTPRVGAQIMVCLDVSKSMLAEDTAPNRLERAKAELTDLLFYLDGDQVGLIAFAGRATVLCPLTPDFGFFRLILSEAGPHSVGRGGTRLEEPIRKALDGFRTEADVSRLLVLITDGEDHDSHPLDAAQAAAERGVKILAIGFGDEAGSEIYVTDPRTGVRTQVRDAAGRPVISRLDGTTLRDMALATEGAYVPAGTGALDLKSIYDAHIAPLVRGRMDDRGHAIRREAFQWAVLAGLVFLVAAVVLGSGSAKSELSARDRRARGLERASTRRVAGAAPLSLAVWAAAALADTTSAAWAQTSQQPEPSSLAASDDGVPDEPPSGDQEALPAGKRTAEEPAVDPRDIYNKALALLDSDFDRAERMLTKARREAGADGDVRFRATYNLGWVEVNRAAALTDQQPAEALEHLRRAADWFRDAVRLRPEHADARHNLEVVLRRILQLADSLAQQNERSMAQRLDALIAAQRNLVSTARQVVDRAAAAGPNAADALRSDFRQLAVEQRKVLSDSQALSSSAREELDAVSGKQDEEKTPQDQVRAAQLTSLLDYMSRASQRLGQARGQMRRRQAERSFRRAAAGLTELKRARDQLRGPVEVLDVILADAVSLLRLTSAKAAADSGRLATPDATDAAPPAWLTRQYLEDEQLSLMERTAELHARLSAAASQTASRAPPEQADGAAAEDQLLARIRGALPYLDEALAALQSASQSLAAESLDQAANQQLEAVAALRNARERFLDVRGLIELAHARETEIQRLLAADYTGDNEDQQPAETAGRLPLAAQLQKENLERVERIRQHLEQDLSPLPPPPGSSGSSAAGSSSSDPAGQQAAARRQQLQLAQQQLELAREEMSQAAHALDSQPAPLDSPASSPADKQPPAEEPGASASADQAASPPDSQDATGGEALAHVERAVEHLQALRRLFFSIVEHLREMAQRQADLNDETERAAALMRRDEAAHEIGPLSLRQSELQAIAEQIGQALQDQAAQAKQPLSAGGQPPPRDPGQLEQLQHIATQLAHAAELVTAGGAEMRQAAQRLSAAADSSAPANVDNSDNDNENVDNRKDDGDNSQDTAVDPLAQASAGGRTTPLDQARSHQDTALQKLVEALSLLQPPQQQQQQQQQQEQQRQQQQQQEEQQHQGSNQQQQAAGLDPARLLQLVRDREAQRRRDRERRGRLQQEPVEKDW